jgi:hypothetical protein
MPQGSESGSDSADSFGFCLGLGLVLVDIFEFLLRKKGLDELQIM